VITPEEWLTLGTAFVGVAGTLAASVITYALANKQERKRWVQEKEDRNQVWEREDTLMREDLDKSGNGQSWQTKQNAKTTEDLTLKSQPKPAQPTASNLDA